MGWSDIWGSMESAVGLGGDEQPTQTANPIAATDPGLSAGLTQSDIAEIDGAAPGSQVGASNPAWWEKPLKSMMPMIMGAALKPQQQLRAPAAPGGHGINANTAGIMKPVEDMGKAANNNPLDDLHSWAGLFK